MNFSVCLQVLLFSFAYMSLEFVQLVALTKINCVPSLNLFKSGSNPFYKVQYIHDPMYLVLLGKNEDRQKQ